MKKIDLLTLQEHNSKWLRKRVGPKVMYKCMSSLIPNNSEDCTAVSQDAATKKLTKPKFYDFYNELNTKSELHINPKYLFTEPTLKKIIKLRNIFLEFDEDGSKMLELHELATMFETNNIPVNINDLINMFFSRNHKFKKNEEPYLDFYQLLLFALDINSDHKFRNFMRTIKEKIGSSNRLNRLSEIENSRYFSRASVNMLSRISDKRSKSLFVKNGSESKDEGRFLPMNFKLLLEYLNSKGKMRESELVINKMNDLMTQFEVEDENKSKIEPIATQPNPERASKISTHFSLPTLNANKRDNNSGSAKHHTNLLESFPHQEISIPSVIKNFQRMLFHSRISSDDNDEVKKLLISTNNEMANRNAELTSKTSKVIDSTGKSVILHPNITNKSFTSSNSNNNSKLKFYSQESMIINDLNLASQYKQKSKQDINFYSDQGIRKFIEPKQKNFTFGLQKFNKKSK